MSGAPIGLVLSDVDGTLVTSDKVLTPSAIAAAGELARHDIRLALTSARPPQGLLRFVEPLALRTPLAAFNGGLIVDADLRVLHRQALDERVSAAVIELLLHHGLSVWVYRDAEWLVLDATGPHVEHEAAVSDLAPTPLASFDSVTDGVIKIVGVSDDPERGESASVAVREQWGDRVAASRSQSYYLDVTHPDANKGSVVRFLSATYDVPVEAIATIGDMQNDVAMFSASGLSIAMGNAEPAVQRAAHHVTRTNDDDGFAHAIEALILPR